MAGGCSETGRRNSSTTAEYAPRVFERTPHSSSGVRSTRPAHGSSDAICQMNLSQLVERWNAAVVPTIKTTTAAYYQKMLSAHVLGAFGHWEISTVGRYQVEFFLAEKAQKYRRNTLRGMRVSLGRVLSWAVNCGWLQKNPCAGVKLPHAGTKVVRTILRPEQTRSLADQLEEPYATLVLFLAVTGLRISEAIEIKWSDFDSNVLRVASHVRRTSWRDQDLKSCSQLTDT